MSGNQYIYMGDLTAMQQCVPQSAQPKISFGGITSPLSDHLEAWSDALAMHPDVLFREYILSGLSEGFRIGFDYGHHSCQPARRNLPSVTSQPLVVQEYIEKECHSGRVLGPFLPGSIEWVFHYLDDFPCLGTPGSDECQQALDTLVATCADLNVPLAIEKVEGPTVSLVFLGIELDTMAMQLRLPEDKLARVKATILEWMGRKAATKRELQSLAGLLQHACKVVRPGRVFLHRVFEAAARLHRPYNPTRLNRSFQSDIAWWNVFLEQWNGVSRLWDHLKRSPDSQVVSDASGAWGCGALWQTEWIQFKWEPSFAKESIAVKELVPGVLSYGASSLHQTFI